MNVLIVLIFYLKLDTLICFDFQFLPSWSHQKSLIHNVFIKSFTAVEIFFSFILLEDQQLSWST